MTALVGTPFGVKGFVKIRSLSGETEHLFRLDSVLLRYNNIECSYRIEQCNPLGEGVVFKFFGIDSPEAARTLTGAEVVVNRNQAAPLRKGEWYVEDLRNIKVITCDGRVLGHIVDIVDGGGGSLAEIQLPDAATRFVPFRDEFMGDVDTGAGTVILLMPELLD
ncbi:ribosome maturation factor RimM [Spirochaetia bacterium]|nr:ribosome maturation factor RimM [Spirochaetia bacterium]